MLWQRSRSRFGSACGIGATARSGRKSRALVRLSKRTGAPKAASMLRQFSVLACSRWTSSGHQSGPEQWRNTLQNMPSVSTASWLRLAMRGSSMR